MNDGIVLCIRKVIFKRIDQVMTKGEGQIDLHGRCCSFDSQANERHQNSRLFVFLMIKVLLSP